MLTIDQTGTQLRLSSNNQRDLDTVYTFINKKLTTYAMPRGRNKVREVSAIYATSLRDHILLHTNVLDDLSVMLMSSGVQVAHRVHTPPKGKYVDYCLKDHIVPRAYQRDAIKFLDAKGGGSSRLLGFSPGTGKTISLLCYLSSVKHMCCGIMKPNYAEQWCKVIPTVLNLDKEDIVFISGSSELVKVQHALQEGTFTGKFILISNKTMQRFLKTYTTDDKFIMTPAEFMTAAGIGTLLIDEVHEDLHFNYLLSTAVTVPRIVGLSGTFISRDTKISAIQAYMFPPSDIYDLLTISPYIKYIEATYYYPFGINPIISERGLTSYSHVRYEKWLLDTPVYLAQFMATLCRVVLTSYVNRRKPGEKILIYAMRSDMVLAMQSALELAIPDTYKLSTYMEGDSYTTLLESDIIISTPIKSGAAVDIPGLITVVSTYITASIQRLIQMLGRLRRIEDRDVIYMQLVCGSIPKHLNYQTMNRDIVEARTESYHVMQFEQFNRPKARPYL